MGVDIIMSHSNGAGPKLVSCPQCGGDGSINVTVHTVPTEGGIAAIFSEGESYSLTCPTCDGRKFVSQEVAEWLARASQDEGVY